MKTYGGVEVEIHASLTSVSFTLRLFYGDSHWMGGWVGPTAGLDAVVKRKEYLPGIDPRSFSL
jgi:hypothetical protein